MEPITIILIAIIIGLLILIRIMYNVGIQKGHSEKEIEWQENLNKIKRDIAERQRVGIKGKVTEAFAPFLTGFPFKASECKFIGDPIDYLVFEGLDERDIKKIHLVEVKTDKSKLSKHQKQIKDIIDELKSKNVTFKKFEFKVDDREEEEQKG